MNEYDATLIIVMILAFVTLLVMFKKHEPTQRLRLTVRQQQLIDSARLPTMTKLYRFR